MQIFIEGITISRKYQLRNQEIIKLNYIDKTPFDWENKESCITSQQESDSFFVLIEN